MLIVKSVENINLSFFMRPVGLEPTIPFTSDELKARYITNSVQGRYKHSLGEPLKLCLFLNSIN